MFERFTDRARRVLVLAQEEARLLGHGFIGTEHILMGLLKERDGVAARALASLDVSLEAVHQQVQESIGVGGAGAGADPGDSPPFTPRAKKVLEYSLREALQLGHGYIGTEHILLGLVREGEGVAAVVLVSLGADLYRVRQQVVRLISEGGDPGAPGTVAPSPHRRSLIVTCSFCSRRAAEGRRLVAGSNAFICEYCIREWARRLAEGEGDSEGEGEGDVATPNAHLYRPPDAPEEGRRGDEPQ
jgi:ATP-dependent Clp protease ATP-binding subunit ClpA